MITTKTTAQLLTIPPLENSDRLTRTESPINLTHYHANRLYRK
ncbi:hypothetical protein NIES4103_48550 [Nostoc sp. NIES-4103]|nr:hypothetical protein NIES4103_48550 [Nostoc sp. NIES-4103]